MRNENKTEGELQRQRKEKRPNSCKISIGRRGENKRECIGAIG